MMQVFQRTLVHTYEYPFAETLNPKLHDIILEKAVNRDFGATMTSWKECSDIKEFRTIADWVYKIILGFDEKIDGIFDLKLKELWGQYYNKGDYHVPHNHSSKGYAGIIYLQQRKDSPRTTYIQPWNNEKDQSVLYSPEVKQGDIMIVPQFLTHYTEPNKTFFKKRIISFDFHLEPVLF